MNLIKVNLILLTVFEFHFKKINCYFLIDDAKKSHNYQFAHCFQNAQQTVPLNSSCMYSIVRNKQEYDSKIQNYQTKQDNSWNNPKRLTKNELKIIEKEIKDTEALHLQLAVALSKETAKEESEFNPFGNYTDYYETQSSQFEVKEEQNSNKAKLIEIRIFILNNYF
jgi:hypothetical protein